MKTAHQIINSPFYQQHAKTLDHSFYSFFKKNLLGYTPDESVIEQLWGAPFALVSHGTEADPIFNFANQKALDAFEMDFEDFIQLPSRLSAEAIERSERESLLSEVTEKGYIANYQGIRISSTGKRFEIKEAIVWNLYDETGQAYGQAAMFNQWIPLK